MPAATAVGIDESAHDPEDRPEPNNCGPQGAPKTLFTLGADALGPPAMPHRYAVTADGQHFVISRTTKEAVPIPLNVILNWTTGLSR